MDAPLVHSANSDFQLKSAQHVADISNNPSLKCDLCEYIPNRSNKSIQASIKIHKDRVHFDIKYVCPHCEILAKTKWNLLTHIELCHQEQMSQPVKIKRIQTSWFDNCSKEEDHCQCCKQGPRELVRLLKCFFCGFKFSDAKSRRIHTKEAHFDRKLNGRFQCNYCSYETKNALCMGRHENAGHEDTYVFNCEQCDFIAENKLSFILHMKNDHSVNIKMFKTTPNHSQYQCPKCDYITKQKGALDTHINSYHTGKTVLAEEPSQKCDICNYIPSRPDTKTLQIHKEIVHLGIRRKCHSCGRQCTFKSNMTRHEKRWHQGVKCEYTIINPSLVKEDNQIDMQGELFQCDVCPFQTRSTQHFTHHQKEHAKPTVKCLKCDHETGTRVEMVAHRKTHNTTKIRKVYRCETCEFEPEDTLKRDERRQQQMRSHSCDMMKCTLCDYQSHLKFNIDKHRKNEHGELKKIAYCTTCEYKSNKKGNVDKHIQTVHEGLRIICPICNKKYTQDSDLR